MGGGALAGGKKNARRPRAWIVFQDESGVCERPSTRRTGAPRGETPTRIHAFNGKKLALGAALAYRWEGNRSRLYFQTRPNNYHAASRRAFLPDRRRPRRGQPATLIGDGRPAHKSRIMPDYLRAPRLWRRVQRLPGEAPHLHPVETRWSNRKGQALAHRGADGRGEADGAVHQGRARVRRSQQLAFAFLPHAGLSF